MTLVPKYPQRHIRTKKIGDLPNKSILRDRIFQLTPRTPATLVDGVFEGGGALGAAYVGALSFLHSNDIWFARVAGNSAGSIIAGMIAVGFTAQEIQWLCSAFPGRPKAPDTLRRCGITSPIPFSSFLDFPTLKDIKASSMRKTQLWKALKGTAFDELGKNRVPIPVQSQAVNDVVGGIFSLPVVGGAVKAIPGIEGAIRGVLNTVLAPLPDRAVTVGDFLPNTEALREKFADTVWHAAAMNIPALTVVTNLLHEGSLFEGRKFLETLSRLFAAKVHGNPDAKVLFKDLKMPLAVIATDISAGRMVVYSEKTRPELEVAEAIRRSMSVPFAFQPRSETLPLDRSVHKFVDGGLCSNFPLWLFTASGRNYVRQLGGDDQRPKIGFVLEEAHAPNASWGVEPARFKTKGNPPAVDSADVLIPILVEKLRELNLPSFTPSTESTVTRELAELEIIRMIAGCTNIDKEAVSRSQIVTAMMQGFTYYDVALPMLGYHWLDFHINEDEDDVRAMWDRSWHATRDALMTGTNGKPLTPTTTTKISPFQL